ncbi:hypothetical protein CN984_12215 [Bacillus cereus]|uniref:Uncharacterized protein n=1 Tax=Bacillus cereus TaxID=1396 RepID=A0A2A7FN98_BACCE|nr:hypothetical protein [Bacillus cereus]PEA25818.1 hypothetical protein CON44_17880 [Bacillus cereus]PGO29201.1 hypothetical protein CN984_12215 [Bacillus cereus]
MIQEHKFNADLSVEVYETCKDSIEMKGCYNNVFNVLRYYGSKFYNNEWKIAYGYVSIHEVEGLMARHAFILDENDNVVDPTIVTTSSFDKDYKYEYVSFKVFNKLGDYTRTLSANDGQPALYNVFHKEEIEANQWGMQRKLMMIG